MCDGLYFSTAKLQMSQVWVVLQCWSEVLQITEVLVVSVGVSLMQFFFENS